MLGRKAEAIADLEKVIALGDMPLLSEYTKEDIEEIKEHLRTHFVTKDMGKSRYFLGIEFAYANKKMALS